jgi:multidrug efflux pump subunit AcrA (membrane-fusion protein)
MTRTIKEDCPLSAVTIPARHGITIGEAAEQDTHERAASAMRRRRIFLAIFLFLSFLSSCSKDTGEKEAVVPVQVATVEKTTLQRTVTAEAVLFPLQQSAIVPKISAPVKAFYVKRGSRVRKGQLLAVLENRDLAAAAQENQGAYNQAEATYATTTSAQLPEDGKRRNRIWPIRSTFDCRLPWTT